MRKLAYMGVVLCLLSAACDDDNDDVTQSSLDQVATHEIVSDQRGADVRDSELVNAWGLAFNPVGVAWVSATETGLSKVYDAQGNTALPDVTIPPPFGEDEPSAPTGQVFNADPNAFEGDLFVFVTEDGVISGWQPTMGGQAVLRVDNSESGAVYKGVTIALNEDEESLLFAADFRGGKIDVFDSNYEPVDTTGFQDTDIPDGFAPFNVEALNGNLIVTYAEQDDDREDDVSGPGNGYVNLFDVNGTLLARLISGGELNSPWGVVMTPETFEAAPNRLLIGNFGDGLIHVYRLDSSNGQAPRAVLEGVLLDDSGDALRIDGLWALEFAPDAGGFSSSDLYYTAGPDDEDHGVFGRIESTSSSVNVPSPGVPGSPTYPN